ncbi:hypothetical protein QN277_001014 [Acacia crassicarpa]|uniref:Uncharacterized protein n=1 Tax=Acacia crassicarpa TaxID=499986 RepID=A0AAE1N7E9_9FABA|nr:hypothetical protein QN277_001014 [Acacia crassicarpa]
MKKEVMRQNSVHILLGIIVVVLLFAECYSSHAVRCVAAKPVKVARSRANDINMQYPVLDKMNWGLAQLVKALLTFTSKGRRFDTR